MTESAAETTTETEPSLGENIENQPSIEPSVKLDARSTGATTAASEGANMAMLLREQVTRLPNKRAILFPYGRDTGGRVTYTSWTFAQLEEETNRFARGLRKVGIRRGTRTVLMVTPSLEFFALTFALFKVGAVLVLIDPGIGLANLKTCLDEAEPEAFIGVTKAHAARVLLRWSPTSIKILVTHGYRLFWGGYTLADLRDTNGSPAEIEVMPSDEMGALIFTSGSTGISKGVVYTHGVLTHQVRFIQDLYQFTEADIDVATFPLFALIDVCLGMTVVIPDMDARKPAEVDPVKLTEGIMLNGATVMFGSPALLDTFSRWGLQTGTKLPTLRTVISCGAPARNDVLARFHHMLTPEALIHTPYGATEALPVTSVDSRVILKETAAETERGGGTCVGRPHPAVEVRIVKVTDDPIPVWSDDLELPVGEIGEIVVRGPIVTRAYFRRPEATKLAKIAILPERSTLHTPGSTSAESSVANVYHRMGDLGRLDAEGRLWFCGRKSHRVVTEQGTMFTIPCERIFNEHPLVFRTALVGVGPCGKQRPVLCVELEAEAETANRSVLLDELLALGAAHPHTQSIKTLLFHPRFPVDARHNAKIGREILAQWAADQLGHPSEPR